MPGVHASCYWDSGWVSESTKRTTPRNTVHSSRQRPQPWGACGLAGLRACGPLHVVSLTSSKDPYTPGHEEARPLPPLVLKTQRNGVQSEEPYDICLSSEERVTSAASRRRHVVLTLV